MKILWISRHQPTPGQRTELTRLFGHHVLDVDTNPFDDAADIARRIRRGDVDEVVCVAPLSVLRKLAEYGFKPLVADMVICQRELAEISTKGRHYRFVRFQRLESVKIEYSEVLPCRLGTTV